MPNYPIAPWLRPADPTSAYTKGYSLGQQGAQAAAAITQAQQRLAHDAQRAQVEVQLKQQAIEQNAIYKQQELEVARAYHDQQVAIEQQKLEQAQEKIKEQAAQAAQKFQAMQAYQRAIASGMDPAAASLQLFPWLGQGGQTAVLKNNMASKEELSPKLVTYGEGDNAFRALVNPKTGAGHIVPAPKEAALSLPQLYNMAYGTYSDQIEDPELKKQIQSAFSGSLQDYFRKKKKATGEPSIENDPSMLLPYEDSATSPFKEGEKVRNKKDGKMYQITNGVPVLIDEEKPDESALPYEDSSPTETEYDTALPYEE